MAKKRYPASFWHPRYWPTWAGFFFIWLAAFMPWPVKRGLGRGLGYMLWALAKSRRHITEVNIALCFPELSPAEQKQRVKDVFIANGIGLLKPLLPGFGIRNIFAQPPESKGQSTFRPPLIRVKGLSS